MDGPEFKRQLAELRDVIADGLACYSAWRTLLVENDDAARAMNRYRGLFIPARVSLQRVALLQFAKVFDPNTRAVSLVNLLAAAQSNPGLLTPNASPDELKEIGKRIDGARKVVKALKSVRDQRIAHHDAKLTPGDKLVYGDLQDLSEVIKDLYNRLSRGNDRSTTSFAWTSDEAERDTTKVIQIMQDERDRASAESLKLIGNLPGREALLGLNPPPQATMRLRESSSSRISLKQKTIASLKILGHPRQERPRTALPGGRESNALHLQRG